jgi:hypothetical protein
MKPPFGRAQGQMIRSVVLYLSKLGDKAQIPAAIVVESVQSRPWASLTFAGEHHRLVIRLPGAAPVDVIDGSDLAVPGCIVAVERTDWTAAADGAVLTLDLLALTANY